MQDRGDDDEEARGDVRGGREDRIEVPGEEGEREDGCGEGEGDPQRREGNEREPLGSREEGQSGDSEASMVAGHVPQRGSRPSRSSHRG